MKWAKGIIHCHSNFSFDGVTPISDIRERFVREGFQFVCLTEHAIGIDSSRFERLVAECRKNSDDIFLVIPGLEFRFENGHEIAAVGIETHMEPTDPAIAIRQIREGGGYSVWVHPTKRNRPDPAFVECDAVEILNGKLDGTIAPNFKAWRLARGRRLGSGYSHVIFGLDVHDMSAPRTAWVECEAAGLTRDALLGSLRAGRFRNRIRAATVGSRGEIRPRELLLLLLLRVMYVVWDQILAWLPERFRKSVSVLGRRVATLVGIANNRLGPS